MYCRTPPAPWDSKSKFSDSCLLDLVTAYEVICACRELLISAATFSMITSAGVAYMPSSVAVPGAEANSSATELLSVASGILGHPGMGCKSRL